MMPQMTEQTELTTEECVTTDAHYSVYCPRCWTNEAGNAEHCKGWAEQHRTHCDVELEFRKN